MDNKKIGEYISVLRKSKNLTQKDLADQLGITDKAISKWERGAGYPDISLLRPLADALGTSVNELLEGEASQEVTEKEFPELDNALDYASKIIKIKEFQFGKILAIILSVCLLLAICTCVIVNVAVNHRLSWSLLVTVCCIMAGCLLLPPLLKKKKGIFYSLCFLSLLLIPFLASIELIISGSLSATGWVPGIGIPVSFVWLIILWLIFLLYKKTKINLWYIICIILIVSIPGQLITNYVIDVFTDYAIGIRSRSVGNAASVIFLLALSGICFILGLNKKKRITA